ncbi:MAG: glycoside hydrolase family 3 N-terminal domain-containing protein [Tractidigestivibacter sp.]|jgi:beta-glucosidase|uniref:glycoside hydrolase family 3 N-terminal domain-containing protein n=1 Tax=Tractidigestivibacter sp. TaxID=2847320 RepID=UPI003D8CACF5
MSKNVSRRNFLQGAALAGAAISLAGCSSEGSSTSDATAAPAADKYPIDPDGDDVEAKWSSEETRDGWTRYTQDGGATIGVMDTSKIIQVDGYAFKDLNGNGKLDLWEDWRQSADDRSSALADELSEDEALALMVHGSIFSTGALTDEITGGGTVVEGNPNPTTQDVIDAGIRTMLNFGAVASASSLARWNNSLQEACEQKTYGIPFNISNNPKDYGFPSTLGLAASFDPDLVKRVSQQESRCYRAEGVATLLGTQMDLATEPRWRRITGTFGEDPALSRDLTNAYASGLQSTYDDDGNDQGWGSESVINMLKHFPGDGAGESGREAHSAIGKYCVYPGDNMEAHLIPFVDGGLHLDSQTGQTASYMDSYSIAYSDDEKYGELVGTAFSKWKNDILREKCEYDGLICSDWGVTEDLGTAMVCTPWGMETATKPERYEKILAAGIDQIGGGLDLVDLKAGYDLYAAEVGEDAALEQVRSSARRVIRTLYYIGLGECPYADSTAAGGVVEGDEVTSLVSEAIDKSIVMLKNAGNVIKESDGSKLKVYIPMSYTPGSAYAAATEGLPVTEAAASELFDIVTDTQGDPAGPAGTDGNPTYDGTEITRATSDETADCDCAFVFIKNPTPGLGYDQETSAYVPISLQYGEYVADGDNVRKESIAGDIVDGVKENRSYYGQSAVASNLSDLELVQSVREQMGDKPVVVCINADRPMVFSELEPYCDAILMGFDASGDDFLNILAGKTEPTGLLPLQMPADMDTVEANDEDVPRDLECYTDSEGNTYDFAFGMNWSGVIDDDRTSTYKVSPLTKSEYVDL